VVDLEGNSRPIEEIQEGDWVLARSEFDPQGPLELKRVEEKFVRTAAVMELVINGQAIKTTAEHPFYVPAQERFVPAGELQVGDLLVSSQGTLIPIESITSLNEITTVYNLRVADYHTYFVGGALWGWDVWVHNAYNAHGTIAAYKAQVALHNYRLRHGLPQYIQQVGATGTVARIRVKGKSFFGVAGDEGKWANVPMTKRTEYFELLQNAGLISKSAKINEVQSLSHAEAMSLMKAIEAFGPGKLGKRLTINVDRWTCGLCKGDGGLNALRKYAGLDELRIVDSKGTAKIFR
jgi:hypothetical protein